MGAVAKDAGEGEKKGRGRPKKPDSEKKTQAYVPTGKPRGRPKGTGKKGKVTKAKAKPAPKKRGPPKAEKEAEASGEENGAE